MTSLRLALILSLLPCLARAFAVDAVVEQHWIEVRSANFRIVTSEPEADARHMVTDLEYLRHISNRVRGTESLAGPPLTIVALDGRGFARLGLPESWAGVFQLSRMGYAALANVDGYAQAADVGNVGRETILHEYHHFLLRYTADVSAYPRWVDEGMSEYWSSLTISNGKAWFGNAVPGNGRETYLAGMSGAVSFDTRELFGTTKLKYDMSPSSQEDLGRFYARARYAVHYFNSSPELRAQLGHYLRLINLGIGQDAAVRLSFKKTYAELDKDMRVYVKRKAVVRGFDIGKDGLDLPEVAVRVTPLDRKATYAALADIVPRFTRRSEALTRELVATNLRLHPDDPHAHALALHYLDQDDPHARLDALLERFPADPDLLALRADALADGALFRRRTGATDWLPQLQAARTLYRRAIKADADNGRSFVGLGLAYAAMPDGEPLEEGIACLQMASVYERDAELFHVMADLHLRRKQMPEALQALRSSVAFGTGEDFPFDALLMENLELLADLPHGTPTATGLKFASGSVYEGPLRDGKPEGKGKWLRPNGSAYEGAFAGGLPDGQGTLVSERGVRYEGEFAAGLAHGQGRIAFPAAGALVSYEGGIDNARPHGAGVLVTQNGRLQARFVQGQAHGDGSFAPARMAAPIKGQWLYGAYDWPQADGIAFTGGIDADGRRDGRGLCRAAAAGGIGECAYRHGKPAAPDAGDEQD